MKKIGLGLVLCVLAAPAMAQMMPSPRTAPHTPVNRETLAERHAIAQRDIDGQAMIIDGEKLRIGDVDLRLFGIVPPQLSASFGPQARAALDALIGGGQTIACHIRDRDHDGRLLATCAGPNGADPALELLRRGLAVAARGSIADTELAQPYVTAEMQAQSQKIGLWSVSIPAAAAPVVVQQPVPVPAPVVIEAPKADAAKTSDVQAKTSSAVMTPVKPVVVEPVKTEVVTPVAPVENASLFARYQILIAGALMLITALSILGALAVYRAREQREEMRALAAALRGELMAARAVCLTRIKSIVTEADDRNTGWPRIRATLYNAYVGKLGWLGAELARQVASIYGQASDYASYYNNLSDSAVATAMPKKQALQTLAAHIGEVLPRLAGIEQTGQRVAPLVYPVAQAAVPLMPEPVVPMMAIASTVEPKKPAPVPSEHAEEAAHTENKLFDMVRHLRERFTEVRQASHETLDDHASDYTAIIEEDMEHFSLGEDDEDDDLRSIGKIGNGS